MRSDQFKKCVRHLSFGLGVFLLFSCQEDIGTNETASEKNQVPYKAGDIQFDSLNLKVTQFLNGDPIPRAQSVDAWKLAAQNKTAAYCLTGSDSANVLYNFYALSDPRGLVERKRMLTMSDAEQLIGKSIYLPTKEQTTERSYIGKFYDLELINWWVIGENDSAMVMCIDPEGKKLKMQQVSKSNGFNVRVLNK